jgi:membrane protein
MTLNLSQTKGILAKSWKEFNDDNAPRLGAALAYYTALSLAPLLILLIALAGFVFGKEAAQGRLFGQLQELMGAQGAAAVQDMVQAADKPTEGAVASIVAFLTLIFGASSVASELKTSLNAIWNREPVGGGIKQTVKERSQALVVILGCGFLLLVSLTVSSVIAGAGNILAQMLPLPEVIMTVLNMILGLLVITGVFAAMFKFLPDVDIRWSDVLMGAGFTAVLFTIGKFAIGMYLGKASVGSAYGAAGSLIVLLIWVYYSAQILFFGVEFTQIYSREHGSDPLRTRQRAVTPKPIVAVQGLADRENSEQMLQSYKASVAGNGSKTLAAVGSVLGSALAISKVVNVFRRR